MTTAFQASIQGFDSPLPLMAYGPYADTLKLSRRWDRPQTYKIFLNVESL